MRILFSALLMFISIPAFANSFDRFVGNYVVTSAPTMTADHANLCNHLDFKNLKGLTIEANTTGYHQTHMMHFVNGSGWYGAPVESYEYNNGMNAGSSAQVTGDANSATVTDTTWGSNPMIRDTTSIKIEKLGVGYQLSMQQGRFEKEILKAACYYQVALSKK